VDMPVSLADESDDLAENDAWLQLFQRCSSFSSFQ
jgi:hypothetical protein